MGNRVIRIMEYDSPYFKGIKEYEELSTGDIIHITSRNDRYYKGGDNKNE